MGGEEGHKHQSEEEPHQQEPVRGISIRVSQELDEALGDVKIEGHHALTDNLEVRESYPGHRVEEKATEEAAMESAHEAGLR